MLASLTASALMSIHQPVDRQSIIIQGKDLAAVKLAVQSVGGEITHELGVINAVSAQLTSKQIMAMRSHAQVRQVYANRTADVAGQVFDTHYPTLIGADDLHSQGIKGQGVTVEVLDTGLWSKAPLIDNSEGNFRVLAQYDVILDRMDPSHYEGGDFANDVHDGSGHGSHITSIALSSGETDDGYYNGVAPMADLVAIRAFDADGNGQYADVIRGIDWVVAHKEEYNIRVLNLSFSAPPRSYYWEDPLNQAVMAAWKAGIVVVASAGNTGPDPMTVGAPGNVPYIITVGAMTDNYTPEDGSDNVLASFSTAGSTHSGFVKPEVVAPGGHRFRGPDAAGGP